MQYRYIFPLDGTYTDPFPLRLNMRINPVLVPAMFSYEVWHNAPDILHINWLWFYTDLVFLVYKKDLRLD